MKTFLDSRVVASRGAALMIVLGFVVLLTGLALAYFSRTTTDRQLAHSSYHDTSADLLARSALDIVAGDLKQEILTGGTTVTRTNIQPQRSGDAPSIPNLIRRSVRNDPIPTPGVSSFASAVSSAPSPSAIPRRGEVTLARWNSHYLVPRLGTANDSTPISNFTAPDWVLLTGQGRAPAPAPNAVIGRYAFAVYDEGGLLDMNVTGYPTWTGAATSSPSPTPWLVNVGRKGTVAFADLTALGANPPSRTQINNAIGWRNYAMTKQPSVASFLNADFSDNGTRQDWYGSYLLYFGDPPFTIESLSDKLTASLYPFTSAAASVWNGRTDQALLTRQELLKLLRSVDPGWQNYAQYLGTFSRERNRPAPDWPNLGGNLSEGRFNLNNLALVGPQPGRMQYSEG